MRLIVYHPEIPQNVGALLRLSACWGIAMDFIGPFPFLWSSKLLKRAGLDYTKDALYQCHDSWESYCAQAPVSRLIALSTLGTVSYLDHRFESTDRLLIGSESCGLPSSIMALCDTSIRIPMREGMRSLNMSMSAAIVLGEAQRQICHKDLK